MAIPPRNQITMWYLGTKTGYFELNQRLICKQEVEGSSPSSSTKLAINWKSPRRDAGAFLLIDPKLTH